MGVGTSYGDSLKNLRSLSRGRVLVVIGILTSSALAGGFLYARLSAGEAAQPGAHPHFFSVLGLGLSEDAQATYEKDTTIHTADAAIPQGNGSTTQSSSKTDVQVNGQSITVPDNGQVHKIIKHEGGQTTVDISSSSSNSSYSTNININSNSSSHGQ